MGKGDKKTKRGKLFSNSYGITRPRKKDKGPAYIKPAKTQVATPKKEEKSIIEAPPAEEKPKAAPKKAAAKKPAAKKTEAPKKEAKPKAETKAVEKEKKEDKPAEKKTEE